MSEHVDLTVEAKSIYEAWNWDMLEAQMESEYDRGAFRELANMYVNLIDNEVSLIELVEQHEGRIENLILEAADWKDEYMTLNRRFAELDKSALETFELLSESSKIISDKDTLIESQRKVLEDISTHVMDITSKDVYYDAYLEVKQKAYNALKGSS